MGKLLRICGSASAMLVALGVLVLAETAAAQESKPTSTVDKYLAQGDLAGGRKHFAAQFEKSPDDAEAGVSLGVLQVFTAVENLGQSLHRHGLRTDAPELPFVRLPLPANDKPQPIDYQKFRGILQQFIDDLDEADATLAEVDDDRVKLKIRVGQVRLDLNGDGRASKEEAFWSIFEEVALGGRSAPPDLAEPAEGAERPAEDGDEEEGGLSAAQRDFVVALDQADVHWLRGYTHLLRAMAQAYLAHDSEHFFNATAFVFFDGAKSPYPRLEGEDVIGGAVQSEIADLILGIHLAHFEVSEPERMKAAHQHLLAMVDQSRACMEAIKGEMDDDREWIPNPEQTSLLPGMNITPERVAAWHTFLDEWEAILEGKKLVPHWRVGGERGINLRRVFHEPKTFDVVMWVHGAGALPYLEEGKCTDRETWNQLQRAFGGNFLGFAVWVN